MKKLFSQYHSTLMSFFHKRSPNVWDAEDLTQEVFCKLLNRKGIVATNECPESYLFTVAWSVLRDRSRRDKVRHKDQHFSFTEDYAKEDLASPEHTVGSAELYQGYLKVLDELSPKARTVFILHRYEGFAYSQIAEHCGMSVSAVEKHMMKALARMKEFLQDR
jgi:RNA polymerase sigma factor (sigma-70 family)